MIDWSRLTPRELEVVEYVALGLRNSDIALACGSSPNTVRNQLTRVFQKLSVASRSELTRLAVLGGVTRRPAR
jgi:DNA-binding CsgD family transcriptional regulator